MPTQEAKKLRRDNQIRNLAYYKIVYNREAFNCETSLVLNRTVLPHVPPMALAFSLFKQMALAPLALLGHRSPRSSPRGHSQSGTFISTNKPCQSRNFFSTSHILSGQRRRCILYIIQGTRGRVATVCGSGAIKRQHQGHHQSHILASAKDAKYKNGSMGTIYPFLDCVV